VARSLVERALSVQLAALQLRQSQLAPSRVQPLKRDNNNNNNNNSGKPCRWPLQRRAAGNSGITNFFAPPMQTGSSSRQSKLEWASHLPPLCRPTARQTTSPTAWGSGAPNWFARGEYEPLALAFALVLALALGCAPATITGGSASVSWKLESSAASGAKAEEAPPFCRQSRAGVAFCQKSFPQLFSSSRPASSPKQETASLGGRLSIIVELVCLRFHVTRLSFSRGDHCCRRASERALREIVEICTDDDKSCFVAHKAAPKQPQSAGPKRTLSRVNRGPTYFCLARRQAKLS